MASNQMRKGFWVSLTIVPAFTERRRRLFWARVQSIFRLLFFYNITAIRTEKTVWLTKWFRIVPTSFSLCKNRSWNSMSFFEQVFHSKALSLGGRSNQVHPPIHNIPSFFLLSLWDLLFEVRIMLWSGYRPTNIPLNLADGKGYEKSTTVSSDALMPPADLFIFSKHRSSFSPLGNKYFLRNTLAVNTAQDCHTIEIKFVLVSNKPFYYPLPMLRLRQPVPV